MFERKPDSEIKKISEGLSKESHDLRFPILFGIFAGGITGFMIFVFGTKSAKPLEFGFTTIAVISMSVTFATVVLLYLVQRVSGRSIASEQPLKVCPKCLKSHYGTGSKCQCGNVLEPREFYNYVENSKH